MLSSTDFKLFYFIMYGPDNKKGNYDYLINVNNKKSEENEKLSF